MAVAADGRLIVMDNFENYELAQELEVLQEIYIEELSVIKDSSNKVTHIDVQLHPSTGENVDQKWVCLTLRLIPLPDYPHSVPEISIRGPRGLAEEHVASLRNALYQTAEERKGSPMLYELIEHAKDSLTQVNNPYGHCMICLEDFDDSRKEFTKTDCYHYFHCSCLSQYIVYCKAEINYFANESNIFRSKQPNVQIVCPVCRKPLPEDLDFASLKFEKVEESPVKKYYPSAEMQELQRKMAELYDKQKGKGGIIDLEEERNKFLLPKDFVYTVKQNTEEQQKLARDAETSKPEKNLHHKQRGTANKGESWVSSEGRHNRGTGRGKGECRGERTEWGRRGGYRGRREYDGWGRKEYERRGYGDRKEGGRERGQHEITVDRKDGERKTEELKELTDLNRETDGQDKEISKRIDRGSKESDDKRKRNENPKTFCETDKHLLKRDCQMQQDGWDRKDRNQIVKSEKQKMKMEEDRSIQLKSSEKNAKGQNEYEEAGVETQEIYENSIIFTTGNHKDNYRSKRNMNHSRQFNNFPDRPDSSNGFSPNYHGRHKTGNYYQKYSDKASDVSERQANKSDNAAVHKIHETETQREQNIEKQHTVEIASASREKVTYKNCDTNHYMRHCNSTIPVHSETHSNTMMHGDTESKTYIGERSRNARHNHLRYQRHQKPELNTYDRETKHDHAKRQHFQDNDHRHTKVENCNPEIQTLGTCNSTQNSQNADN